MRAIEPAPFRESMRTHFGIPTASLVRFQSFDVAGRQVAHASQENLQPGDHLLEWDRRASSGERAGSGVYFYLLETAAGSKSGKLVRLQ